MAQRQSKVKVTQHMPASGLTPEEYDLALQDRNNTRLRIQFGGSAGLIVATAIPLTPMVFVARALAGRETALSITVTVTIALTLIGVTSVLGLCLKWLYRRYKHTKDRAEALRRCVHELRQRLRANKIDDKISSEAQKALTK